MDTWLVVELSLVLAAAAGPRPDFGWAARDHSVFPIGWTADGSCFAYGTFDYSIMISNQGNLRIAVRDLKTDSDLWDYTKYWDEGNAGDGSGDMVPRTTAEAWDLVKGAVEPRLTGSKILTGGPRDLTRFPMLDGDARDITITEEPEADSRVPYTVKAVSRSRGTKTICQNTRAAGNELSLLGYYANPDGSRIAVVVVESSFSWPFPAYHVIGCHTRNGFKKE